MDDVTDVAEGLDDTSVDDAVIDSTPDAEPVEATTDTEPLGTEDANLYAIKVGGEERQVTLEELTRLAQQGDDYTRKSQSLADERRTLARAKAIQEALEADPASALAALSQAYGIGGADGADDELMDPMERRLRDLERQLQTREERERNAQIERELGELRSQFGEFDEDELFAHAVAGGFTTLRAAYRDLKFDSVYETQRQAQEQATRTAAKRDAQVVHAGAAPSGASAPKGTGSVSSIRDAWAQAKAELAT